MVLFFDTETTGKGAFKEPATSPLQPYIVQLAACLADDEGAICHQFEFVIRPQGWKIHPEAEAVHGYSQAFCEATGIQMVTAVKAFDLLCKKAHVVVAHNINFDSLIMNAALHRLQMESAFTRLPQFCTMLQSVNHCKIPSKFPKKSDPYKWPSLQEAHRHFGLGDFDGAHSALADVMACKRVYFALKAQEKK